MNSPPDIERMMIARENVKTQVLVEPQVWRKLEQLEPTLNALLQSGRYSLDIPEESGRDVQILPIRELPPKKGLSSKEGQARLLHDLASIELQAMELGARTLAEFPQAPSGFREQLAVITLEEASHLKPGGRSNESRATTSPNGSSGCIREGRAV
jgi:uncharacterized ferritin-like protein (DUF455 family)